MSNGLLAPNARFADLALVTYLAPVLVGRRVAVVGPSSGDVTRRVRALGAASVVALGGVGEDIAVRALTPGAIAGLHGRVDVIVVPDAGAVPSLVAVLDEARRALGSEGVVVVASQPTDNGSMEVGGRVGPDFHDLYDLCAGRFAQVRMFGRGPFVGYTVAALDDAAPDVALDTRLMDGDPPRPEGFIAVASDTAVTLDPMAVVQVPGEVLDALREAASAGLREELTRRDQKLKEVETASAERWVRIQRYEHGIKELEEETRKTRERAVRLSKDLEDERKLRQRIELEAQMVRRAPELPKAPDLEPELRRVKEHTTGVERALAAAQSEARATTEKASAATRELAVLRDQLSASRARIDDLVRELDETQAVEVDLRGQLDEALEQNESGASTEAMAALATERDASRREADALRREIAEARTASERDTGSREIEADYQRLERELAARAGEVAGLRRDVVARDESIRELAFTVAENLGRPAVEVGAEWKWRFEEAARVHEALVEQAEAVAIENAALRARTEVLEAQAVTLAGEAQQAVWRVQEMELARGRGGDAEPTIAGLRRDLGALDAALAGMTQRARQSEEASAGLVRMVEEERAGRVHERARVDEMHAELARMNALAAGLETRAEHLAGELAGAREGFLRRGKELEAEVERLVQALAIAGAAASDDVSERVEVLARELAVQRAEAQGVAYRLREAEAALAARSGAAKTVSALASALDDDDGDPQDDAASRFRLDQLLADLSATAERLAEMEEAYVRVQDAHAAALAEIDALRTAPPPIEEAKLRAAVEDYHSRVVQEEARAQVLTAALADRDEKLERFERQVVSEVAAIRHTLSDEQRVNRTLRSSLEVVRAGLSSILIEGRGAVVAHDLVLLLRQIEGAV